MNSGKRFENNFKNSIPDNVYCYRFKDGTSAWDGGNARFQAKNICDYLVYYEGHLYFFELKSHKGKSIPLSCITQDDDLEQASSYNIKCGLMIELADINRVFYVDILDYKNYKNSTESKSVPLKWLEDNAIEVGVKKKKVNIELDVLDLLNRILEGL